MTEKNEDLNNAVELLETAIDMTGEPNCWYDHHGYCQAHNLEPKGECWVEQSKALITKIKGENQ